MANAGLQSGPRRAPYNAQAVARGDGGVASGTESPLTLDEQAALARRNAGDEIPGDEALIERAMAKLTRKSSPTARERGEAFRAGLGDLWDSVRKGAAAVQDATNPDLQPIQTPSMDDRVYATDLPRATAVTDWLSGATGIDIPAEPPVYPDARMRPPPSRPGSLPEDAALAPPSPAQPADPEPELSFGLGNPATDVTALPGLFPAGTASDVDAAADAVTQKDREGVYGDPPQRPKPRPAVASTEAGAGLSDDAKQSRNWLQRFLRPDDPDERRARAEALSRFGTSLATTPGDFLTGLNTAAGAAVGGYGESHDRMAEEDRKDAELALRKEDFDLRREQVARQRTRDALDEETSRLELKRARRDDERDANPDTSMLAALERTKGNRAAQVVILQAYGVPPDQMSMYLDRQTPDAGLAYTPGE